MSFAKLFVGLFIVSISASFAETDPCPYFDESLLNRIRAQEVFPYGDANPCTDQNPVDWKSSLPQAPGIFKVDVFRIEEFRTKQEAQITAFSNYYCPLLRASRFFSNRKGHAILKFGPATYSIRGELGTNHEGVPYSLSGGDPKTAIQFFVQPLFKGVENFAVIGVKGVTKILMRGLDTPQGGVIVHVSPICSSISDQNQPEIPDYCPSSNRALEFLHFDQASHNLVIQGLSIFGPNSRRAPYPSVSHYVDNENDRILYENSNLAIRLCSGLNSNSVRKVSDNIFFRTWNLKERKSQCEEGESTWKPLNGNMTRILLNSGSGLFMQSSYNYQILDTVIEGFLLDGLQIGSGDGKFGNPSKRINALLNNVTSQFNSRVGAAIYSGEGFYICKSQFNHSGSHLNFSQKTDTFRNQSSLGIDVEPNVGAVRATEITLDQSQVQGNRTGQLSISFGDLLINKSVISGVDVPWFLSLTPYSTLDVRDSLFHISSGKTGIANTSKCTESPRLELTGDFRYICK